MINAIGCPKCGASNHSDRTTCWSCAAHLSEISTSSDVVPQQTLSNQPAPATATEMNLMDEVVNVVTFGGHGRLKAAKQNYKAVYDRYADLHSRATRLKGAVDQDLFGLGEDTKIAFKTLKKAHKLLVQAEPYTLPITGLRSAQVAFDGTPRAALLLSNYSGVSSLAGGAGMGSATAIGSWSLVSLLGNASTGTAISTLSGIAARNATLAWFGGGSLATGGAGMAGGSLFIGGLIIVPAIVFAIWHSHAKASEIEEETRKVAQSASELDTIVVTLSECRTSVSEQRTWLNAAHTELSAQLAETNTALFPHGILSKLWRKVRSLFGQEYYRETESHVLLALDQKIKQFTACFQTPEIDSTALKLSLRTGPRVSASNVGTVLGVISFVTALLVLICGLIINVGNKQASSYPPAETGVQSNVSQSGISANTDKPVSQEDTSSSSSQPPSEGSATISSSNTQDGVFAFTSLARKKFSSPDGSATIECVPQDQAGSIEADIYVSFSPSGVQQKLDSNLFFQWTPVWSPDNRVVALHSGSPSMGISPRIYEINEQSSHLLLDIDYDVIWSFALEKGCIPQGTTPSHLYIRALRIDPTTNTVQVSVYGNGDRNNHGVSLKPFDIFVNYRDKSLSTSKPSRSAAFIPQPASEVPIASDTDRALDTFVDAVSTTTLEADSFEGELTDWDLTRLRNAPYARHGYTFGNARLRAYFSQRTWYKPTTTSQSVAESHFSPAERANVALIQSYQDILRHRTP